MPGLRLRRALALALLALALPACPGPKCNPGEKCAADAGPAFCVQQNGSCATGASACCGNLTCAQGVCVEAKAPACAAFGAPCGASLPCCAPPAPDGGWPAGSVPPVPGCFVLDGGFGVCFEGQQAGDPCGAGKWGCANGLVCSNGACGLPPATGVACPRADGGCEVGDDCSSFAANFFSNCSGSQNSDPCTASGLDCEQTAQATGCSATGFSCQQPSVVAPPEFPLVQAPQAFSLCGPGSVCSPLPGDTAAPVCGTFFYPGVASLEVCVEACQKGDDCGSLAWDCLGGSCVPNYCYAEPDQVGTDVAAEISALQGTPVSKDPKVLFQPCQHGGPNTVCLPQNDNAWNSTTGICYRVGDSSAGGAGAACDPSGARSDLGGLCQSGTLCYKGSCLPWCDTGNKTIAACPSGEICEAVGGALVSSTANDNGTGVCTAACNPYLDAAHNSCPQGQSGTPPMLCKVAGTDNDLFPTPGVCVGGRVKPLALGAPCEPFGWEDPCGSGALCVPAASGKGYLCAQVCDPAPSPGVAPPAAGCGSGKSCQGIGPPGCFQPTNADGGFACYHVGACL